MFVCMCVCVRERKKPGTANASVSARGRACDRGGNSLQGQPMRGISNTDLPPPPLLSIPTPFLYDLYPMSTVCTLTLFSILQIPTKPGQPDKPRIGPVPVVRDVLSPIHVVAANETSIPVDHLHGSQPRPVRQEATPGCTPGQVQHYSSSLERLSDTYRTGTTNAFQQPRRCLVVACLEWQP